MLVLTRKVGESIIIAGNIRVMVTATDGGRVRIGIEAPRDVSIVREEIAVHQESLGTNQKEASVA